jgi:Na+-translocating ferredoxin:NAD+ oxidoreductase RnfG subunit
MFKLIRRLLMSLLLAVLVFAGLLFGRQWYDSLLLRIDYNRPAHTDQSKIASGIQSQVKPQVALVYENRDGQLIRTLADAEAYSEFVRAQINVFEQARAKLRQQAEASLQASLDEIFQDMRGRVDRFADWYFGYDTTYKILWEAVQSAARHALSPAESVSIQDGVAYDVERYLQQHYESLVLRPEINDPRLAEAYRRALTDAHNGYLTALAAMQADFQVFVARHTTHTEIPAGVQMELDWHSQFNKMQVADYQKGSIEALRGAGLTLAGGAMGKAVAGKAVGGAAGKGVLAKLSAPFVSKAVSASAGGAAGAVGGPLGTGIGAGIGLAVDYLINEGLELAQRDDFIVDANDALDATRSEWESQFAASLRDSVDVWINDSIQLLPQYAP